ncbi:MAG: 5-oxoprolinase subunit PxpB [Winogradskyella sp.]|uniref:5-oxoprolinase subunit PxpB n=1 Tax=Winogradskyella sp. TaxID=1883156 RepID=UPI003859CB0B
MTYHLKYSQYNERSVLIEWPAIIDDMILQDILEFKNKIENKYIKQKVELVCVYNSILIIYDSTIDNVNDVFFYLKQCYNSQINAELADSKTFQIPVCYDVEFGLDLDHYSKEINLSKSHVIQRHSEAIYTVYFIGFLPGFLYLGGLDSTLHLDRKTTPNLNVKKGSVGIGGHQTGIYPQDSPGGWHIIGNSPVELFNTKQQPPCFVKAGDHIKFQSISTSEYFKIQKDIANSTFNYKTLLVHD